MRRNYVTLCLTGFALVLAACENTAQPVAQQTSDTVVATLDDLPNCTEKRAGEIEKVESKKAFYICDDGKWEPLQVTKEEKEDEKEEEEDDLESSSSAKGSREHREDYIPESSSSQQRPVASSQSVNPPQSSAASEETDPYPVVSASAISTIDCSYAMYCPQDCRHTSNTTRCGKVYTGVDDGSGTQGYLWSYTDTDINGTSFFYWPEGLDSYGSFETPSRDKLGYLKGTAHFGRGFDYPFARMGFWVKGEDKSANITSWNGMCLVYSATQDFYLIIRFAGDDEATASDLIQAKIPKRTSKSLANVSWDDFVQEGWGTAVDRSDVFANAERIEISFKGDAGTSNEFSIYAIGKYGNCNR